MISIASLGFDMVTANDLHLEVHGGGDSGAGLLTLLDSVLGAVEKGVSGGSSWSPIAGIGALGSNVHPVIVHFPIAFLLGFFVCEVIGLAWRRPGYRHWASGMLYLGALGAVAAATAGIIAGNSVPHGEAVHEIMEWHERLGLTVAVLAVSMALWRAFGGPPETTMSRGLHLALAGIIALCLYVGGDLGGLMVYQYGVGVKSLQGADTASQHEHANITDHRHPATEADSPPRYSSQEPTSDIQTPILPTPTSDTNQQHHHHHHHHHH